MSPFKKPQFDKLIKPLVVLNANCPASPSIKDLLVAAIGEGSSTGPLSFIKVYEKIFVNQCAEVSVKC